MDDTEYWNSFYKNIKIDNLGPSSFATFIGDKITNQDKILELGCGNGRDTFFFAERCREIVGIDSSILTIKKLSNLGIGNATFVQLDAKNINQINFEPTVVYSRFFFHSIDEDTEEKILDWVSKLPESTMFCMECRSEKDMSFPKHFGKEHYRRGASLEKFKKKLERNKYEILFSVESCGLAPYKEEDPFIIRIIAIKK